MWRCHACKQLACVGRVDDSLVRRWWGRSSFLLCVLLQPRALITQLLLLSSTLAGVALVEAHGEALAQQLLPQFESYLDRGAAGRLGLSESRYDLVREGVVVLLGMMAGHLAPGDDKVGQVFFGGCQGGAGPAFFPVSSQETHTVSWVVPHKLSELMRLLAAAAAVSLSPQMQPHSAAPSSTCCWMC